MDNIKLPDLITRWMEVQKTRVGLDDGNPLKFDVIDLTLLLKSMGLKLEYLDFEQDKANTDTLTVDIKCHKSGVMARMSYDLIDCSCPEKDEKETSFWEVQATGPKVFSKFKNNTSSNLLPEVSENCSMVSKAMLSNLLDYYKSSIKSIERGEDVLRSPLKVASPKILVTSPGMSMSSPFATPPAEGKFMSRVESCRSPDGSNKTDHASSSVKPKSLEGFAESPPKPSTEQDDTKSMDSSDSVEIDNATREMSKNDSLEKPAIKIEAIQEDAPLNTMPDDNSFANSEAIKALITSSPNEKIFDSLLNIDQNHERDLNVIHCLQQARQQIDAALLVMRLNNPCRDLTHASTITTTPQTVIRKKILTPKLPERSSSLSNIGRRMSMPGRPSDSPKTLLNSGPGLIRKKTPVTSQLASAKPSASRGDTPRPSAAQLKSVSMLRKTNSITSTSPAGSNSGPTGRTASVSAIKKPIGGAKPGGSVRPTTSAIGKPPVSIGRSMSTTAIEKK